MMKRCKIGKKMSGAIALAMTFVIGVTPMTAFAQANPEGNQVVVEESVSDNSVVDKQTVTIVDGSGNVATDTEGNVDNVADDTTEAVDTELPYSYTVNEDGSIVFNFNGEEYVYGEEEDPTGTLKEDVYPEYRDQLTMCAPDEFDALYEELSQKYLDAGYQAIIDERQAAFDDGLTTRLQ